MLVKSWELFYKSVYSETVTLQSYTRLDESHRNPLKGTMDTVIKYS